MMRNSWIISIILVLILFFVSLFPRTWGEAAGIVTISVFLGLLFAWAHRFIRKAAQGRRAREIALGIFFIPLLGVSIILLAVVGGFVAGIFTGVNVFQESVAQLNPNDPVAQGSAPLLAIPSLFEGGIFGLTVLWYGFAGGCLTSAVGFVYALIYPWLLIWAEKSVIKKNELSTFNSSKQE
jgi:hypothetical protein